MKFGTSVISKICRTLAINGIIGFIEILSPINFSLRAELNIFGRADQLGEEGGRGWLYKWAQRRAHHALGGFGRR